MKLLGANCPSCSSSLQSFAIPRLRCWPCLSCGRSWAEDPARPGELGEILRTTVASRFGEPLVHLPIWEIPLSEPRPVNALPQRILLPAFGLQRASILMEFSRRLSLAQPERVARGGEISSPLAAEIPVAEAWELAELIALASVPGWPMAKEAGEVQLAMDWPRLLDWPFARDGQRIMELVAQQSMPFDLALVLGEESLRGILPLHSSPSG